MQGGGGAGITERALIQGQFLLTPNMMGSAGTTQTRAAGAPGDIPVPLLRAFIFVGSLTRAFLESPVCTHFPHFVTFNPTFRQEKCSVPATKQALDSRPKHTIEFLTGLLPIFPHNICRSLSPTTRPFGTGGRFCQPQTSSGGGYWHKVAIKSKKVLRHHFFGACAFLSSEADKGLPPSTEN